MCLTYSLSSILLGYIWDFSRKAATQPQMCLKPKRLVRETARTDLQLDPAALRALFRYRFVLEPVHLRLSELYSLEPSAPPSFSPSLLEPKKSQTTRNISYITCIIHDGWSTEGCYVSHPKTVYS